MHLSWWAFDWTTMFAILIKRWREEDDRWQQSNTANTGERWKAPQSVIVYYMKVLPGPLAESGRIAPWHLQRDSVWWAWEGEPGCHSSHFWEDFLSPEARRPTPLSVRCSLPSSRPPGRCAPGHQFWSWCPDWPACPISPDSPGPAPPFFSFM